MPCGSSVHIAADAFFEGSLEAGKRCPIKFTFSEGIILPKILGGSNLILSMLLATKEKPHSFMPLDVRKTTWFSWRGRSSWVFLLAVYALA